jgi:extracellular factor (EF) 3-hydroxypalmitic acid methyl ester biosynthesis protein
MAHPNEEIGTPINLDRLTTKRFQRPKKMRARRLRVEELRLGPVQARCHHTKLGDLSASVEDLSMRGLALVVAGGAARGELVLSGDRLRDLTVSCASGPLYQGRGTVRHTEERGDDLVLGVALDTSPIDLSEVYRRGTRSDFARRWERVMREAEGGDISPEFKNWVSDLRVLFASTEAFLEAEERALENDDQRTASIARAEYLKVVTPELQLRIDEARQGLQALVSDLTPEQHASYRAWSSAQLSPFLKQSPFLRRALEKPLGYAGDYEMMNMLYRDPNEGETLFGRAINICFTDEPAAKANKNRISYIGSIIRKAILRKPTGRVCIASLGCGPAREIETLLTESPELGERIDVALIDQEERAIAHCEQTLAPLAAATGARVHFIRESLRTLLQRERLSQKLGRCELIYSAGLFDYLDDRMFRRVLGVLYEALAEGGMLAIGNVALHNPSRWVMEYFVSWFLIHRTPEQLRSLASDLTPAPGMVTVDAEQTFINLFLQIRR